MQVPEKLIRSEYIENEDKVFLIIVQFHRNGIINDQSLNHYFKSLKDGTLGRLVNTYHSKLNDKWYDHEGMFTIIKDIYEDEDHKLKMPKSDIPFDIMLKYLNRYHNKCKNYCVDALYYQFIKPLIEQYQSRIGYHGWSHYSVSNSDAILLLLANYGFNLNVEMFCHYEAYGYCCSDCSGDRDKYNENQFQMYAMKNNVDSIKDTIHRYITSLYTADYLKNPTKKPLD